MRSGRADGVDSRRAAGTDMAGLPEPTGAVVMMATGIVLLLALLLTIAVANAPSLSAGTRWLLLILALGDGILAVLRLQGTL
jgi:hypothetical protein